MSNLDKLLGRSATSEKLAMARARAARVATVVALGTSADRSAVHALLDQLADERDWPVRHKLRVAITRQCRRHRDHGAVVAAAEAADDDATRRDLVDALTAAKSPAAFGLWVTYFVRHDHPGYRSCAAMGLRRLADPRATPYLLELALDPVARPRAVAIEALGAVRAPRMLPVVVAALDDPDREVASNASSAVRKFGVAGWEALVAHMRDHGPSAGSRAAVTWYLTLERSEALFIEVLRDPMPELRHAALACLNAWAQRFASDAMRDAIGVAAADPVAFVRERAVLALRWFGTTKAARAALERALEDPDAAVRAMAADSIAMARWTY